MALDDADKAVITELIKAALKPDVFAAHINAALKPVTDRVEALAGDVTKLGKPAELEKPPGGGKQNDVEKAIQAALEPVQKQLAAEKAAREAAESAKRNADADTALREALVKAGIRAEFVPALNAHFRASGTLKANEDGTLGMPGKDLYQRDIIVPIDVGVAEWAKSPEADLWRPAKGLAGSQGDPRSGIAPSGGATQFASLDSINTALGLV